MPPIMYQGGTLCGKPRARCLCDQIGSIEPAAADALMTTRSLSRLLMLGLPALLAAGCTASRDDVGQFANDINVYDTGSTDAERFARQAYPVWNRAGPYKERDLFREERYTDNHKAYVRPEPNHIAVHTSDDGDTIGTPIEDGVSANDTSLADDVTTQSITTRKIRSESLVVTTQSIPVRNVALYGKLDDAGHWLPPIPIKDVPSQYLRAEVSYPSSERPGTIIVDTGTRHLYLILGHDRAIRYGVGIGRQGYAWKGRGVIKYKQEWPRWTPSENYVSEKPEMKKFSASYGGLVGGIKNPLGARALYIYAGGEDTLFRVHGTPDWKSIGKQASSGCIRMFNQDVIDLYGRVPDGATIIVQ
jgi:lipoprotein-anchoring transpeptidase ErfK/SrfK